MIGDYSWVLVSSIAVLVGCANADSDADSNVVMEKHKQDLIYGADFWQNFGSSLQTDTQDKTKIVHSVEKDAWNHGCHFYF